MHLQRTSRFLAVLLAFGLMSAPMFGATSKRRGGHRTTRNSKRLHASRATASGGAKVILAGHHPLSHLSRLRKSRFIFSPWTEPTFGDSTAGDLVDGEDLVVRRAAVQALGPFNGTVVVTDPRTGRLLSIVNQNLALKSGYEPCSTIKLVSPIAGLNEGVIDRDTTLRVSRRASFDLTRALAKSNNTFFAQIGYRLGFQKISSYARLMGLGEKATLDIAEEQPGTLPSSTPS